MPYSLDDIRGFRNRVEAQNTPEGVPQLALSTDRLYDQSQPVQARELFTVQPQPQPQQDDNESLFEKQSVDLDPVLAQQFEPNKKQFYESFARGFNSRRFTGLKDYENWLKTLPGAVQEIQPYIQEIGEKYMPTAAKQEWEAKQRDKMARQQIISQVSLQRAMQDEMQKQGLPFRLSSDNKGNVVPKLINDPAEQKAKDSRLKTAISMREKAGSAKEREYFQNQIDTLMSEDGGATGAPSKPQAVSRETFIQGFTAKKGYAPSETMIQGMIARGYVK
jgi:hypothetical protein